MRRAFVAALLGTLVAMASLASPQVATAEESDLTPMERFGACVGGGTPGNVLMLFDTSGSLKETDPTDARVNAAITSIEGLSASMAEVPDAKLSVAVAGFANTYVKSLDWTDLNEQNLPAIRSDLESYRANKEGLETDYWTAVDGARREFVQRAGGRPSCNLFLWFSDGGFSIAKRSSDDVMQRWGGPKGWAPDNKLRTDADVRASLDAANRDFCRPGGVADQLRSLDVISLGIGLAVDTDPATFDLMRGVTAGDDCGDITTPTPGVFLMATDIDELTYNFITSTGNGDPDETPACVVDLCPEGTRTFVLDGSIGSVQATAMSPVEGARIFLKPRSGDPIELSQGSETRDLPGAKLAWKWDTPRVMTMSLTREGQDETWIGPWGIVFVADQATDQLAKSTISLKGDIAPVLTNRDVNVQVGEQAPELELGVVNSSGERIDPATLSDQTTLDVKLMVDGEVRSIAGGLTKTAMEQPLAVPMEGLNPGVVELILTLDVTTQSWSDGTTTVEGTRLEPRHASYPLTVAPPANFPTIPAKVSFGSTEKPDPVTVDVPLTGEGCAWLPGETTFTGYPEGLGQAKLTSPATSKDDCAAGSLQLTLDPGGLGNGSFLGTTKVMLAPKDSTAEPVAVDLAFELDQRRPISQPVLWTTLIGVTLLGIAIPLGILYLTKFLTAKIPGQAVLAGTVTGPVDESRAFTDDGVPLSVATMAMAHLTNRKEVTVAGRTLKAKMGAALTEPGFVVVDTPGPSAGGRGTLQSAGGNAKLPLAVQGNWMVALDPHRPVSGPVEVTVFTAPGAAGLNEVFDDIRSNIRTAVAKLREGLPPDGGGSADPWGGGGNAGPTQPDPWSSPQAPTLSDPWSNPGGSRPAAPPQPGPAPSGPPPRPPQAPPANDPWANPPGSQTSGPSSW